MALVFITTASATAGAPLHITVRDDAGEPVDNSTVVWSGLPASCTATPDADPMSGGFVFMSTTVSTVSAKATVGAASATIILSFRGLKFTA